MNRSVSEIQAMALKAARGAGIDLGYAEEFARAVATLAMTRPEALGTCAPALHSALVSDAPLAIDALRAGHQDVALNKSPLAQAYLDRAALDFGTPYQIADGWIRRHDHMPHLFQGPVFVTEDAWAGLAQLAAKTYVAASDASRNAGAGAGNIDND